jgi:hypothetical protein
LSAIESEITQVEWFAIDTEAIAKLNITAMNMLEELYDELAASGIPSAMA